MSTVADLVKGLRQLFEKVRANREITEEELRTHFKDAGILESLGYTAVGKDIRIEKRGPRGRTDIHCLDDYKNVIFVIEFKNPTELNLDEHFDQLWDRYVKPLRARYGILTNGLDLLIYERINSNYELVLRVNLGSITSTQCEEIYERLQKPSIKRTMVGEVLKYFEKFDKPEERINLASEVSQEHFFNSFELKEDSVFRELLQRTVELFNFDLPRSKFLASAYDFWKASYAKKPERVPENWKKIIGTIGLTTSDEDLYKFMFCLETAYALFTRLILAKACEDYKLPGIDFSDFIKREIKRTAHRGTEISLLAWAITAMDLIEDMKRHLVKSVFEGDIFYWWIDGYKGLSVEDIWTKHQERQVLLFGEALAEIILTLYKFDFSEIIGDPLGTLYQRYFDKETRKALGEFYTPKEIVEYIINAVGYEGRGVIDKRLLDPACGSGTFLVEALKRYLKAAKESGEEMNVALKRLCNEYHIVGFDIHPFATFMAQMQFMLVLIPAYKKAIEEDSKFVLNRLPIFRTDSLVDETKGEAQKVTLMTYANGTRKIKVDTSLPIRKGDGMENLKIEMPYDNDVISDKAGLLNIPEYFAALQAVFDTVKESAWQEKYEVDKEKLERNFKGYLENKDWNKLVSFFTPYAQHFLEKFKELKDTFGDGRLIKSIEDIILAALLKNYVKYDFVVGNPPYVRVQTLSPESKKKYSATYQTVTGNYDLYIPFIERGISWLSDNGKLGYISSNRFATVNYGKGIRGYILKNTDLLEFLDFRDTRVFENALNYPAIFVLEKGKESRTLFAKVCRMIKKPESKSDKEILAMIKENLEHIYSIRDYYPSEFFDVFGFKFLLDASGWYLMPPKELKVYQKITKESFTLSDASKTKKSKSALSEGSSTGAKEIYVVEKATDIDEKFLLVTSRHDNKHYKIERALLKRYIEDTGKWQPKHTNDLLIFPYQKSNEMYDLIPEAELQKNYPLSWAYLNSKKDLLLKRKDIKDKEQWYAYSAPRSLDYYEEAKILVQGFSIYSSASIDINGGLFFGPDIYGLRIKDEYKDKTLLLLAILNSHITNFYIRHVGVVHGSGYYKFEDRFIKHLPIHLPQIRAEQKLADKITNKVKQIIEKAKLEQKIEKFPDEYIQEYRSKGVEFDTIEMIFDSDHKAIEPIIEESIDGGFNVLIGKNETPIFVESKVKANYVVAALKGKSAKKGEKMQILVPRSDAIIKEILGKLEVDRANTKTPSIKELEEEINERVYKLYGLVADDIKVIEDFLARF